MTAAVNSYGINAGGINGADQRYLDASLSQGANTVVTAGTVGIVSTASISQGANTVSSAAANAIVAAFAQTQGADTVVTAGTVGVVAASSLSQGADTIVTAGTVGIAADAAVTQGVIQSLRPLQTLLLLTLLSCRARTRCLPPVRPRGLLSGCSIRRRTLAPEPVWLPYPEIAFRMP